MKVKVELNGDYLKVKAIRIIHKGDEVLKLTGRIITKPTKYTIQLCENKHLESFSSDYNDNNSVWRYINHSCSPNCIVDTINLKIIADKNILPGEEITFDYNTTEYEMVSPFNCACKNEMCKGEIKGSKYQPKITA